jgi:hypothetical protein
MVWYGAATMTATAPAPPLMTDKGTKKKKDSRWKGRMEWGVAVLFCFVLLLLVSRQARVLFTRYNININITFSMRAANLVEVEGCLRPALKRGGGLVP